MYYFQSSFTGHFVPESALTLRKQNKGQCDILHRDFIFKRCFALWLISFVPEKAFDALLSARTNLLLTSNISSDQNLAP